MSSVHYHVGDERSVLAHPCQLLRVLTQGEHGIADEIGRRFTPCQNQENCRAAHFLGAEYLVLFFGADQIAEQIVLGRSPVGGNRIIKVTWFDLAARLVTSIRPSLS